MNTNKTSARFTIDFINHKIVGTKASFDKAGKGEGAIYEELASKIAKHPDFTLEVKEQKKHTTRAKRTYNGMDFDFMKDFISIQKNSEQVMKEYNEVKKMAEDTGRSVYPFTKKWFLDKFSTDEKPFDMETAKEAITNALYAKAEKNANAPATEEATENTSNDLALAS